VTNNGNAAISDGPAAAVGSQKNDPNTAPDQSAPMVEAAKTSTTAE